ncbi:MAG: hypothetical protein LBE95_00795 [Holosporaceae bacterium]|jgi:ADP-heptose:LPS heptosyltransferase|nr:hypothetical protein [Holosporaceae bacterium]
MKKLLEILKNIKQDSRVVLCGAGKIGKMLYEFAERTRYFQIIMICDRDFASIRQLKCEYGMTQISSYQELYALDGDKYDFCLIGIKNFVQCERELIENGITKSKIIKFADDFVKKKEDDGNKRLRIAYESVGGFGDTILCTPFYLVLRKIVTKNLDLEIFSSRGVHMFPFAVCKNNASVINFEEYDVVFRYDALIGWSPEKVKRFSPLLFQFYYKHEKNTFIIHRSNFRPLLLMRGLKRGKINDIDGVLPYDDTSRHFFAFSPNSLKVLGKYNLTNRPFLLINNDMDDYNYETATKLYPAEQFQTLISQIKNQYHDIVIINVGARKRENNDLKVDIDLVGKTTFDEALVLLKHAVLLIAPEGGMVHSNHAVNGTSLCIFGPTIPQIYGYAENINVRSDYPDVCKYGCEWSTGLYPYWTCIVDFDDKKGKCMTSLKPQYVFEKAKEYLDKWRPLQWLKYDEISKNDIQKLFDKEKDVALIERDCDELLIARRKEMKSLTIFAYNLNGNVDDTDVNSVYYEKCKELEIDAEYSYSYNISSREDCFDVVFTFALSEELHSDYVLKEMARVTKPGGVVAIGNKLGEKLLLYRKGYAEKGLNW